MTNIKQYLFWWGISLLLMPTILWAQCPEKPLTCPNSEYTIKFSHVVAEDTPKGSGANRFEELVEERLDCRVEVIVYPNAECYNDTQVMGELILGHVQMAAPSVSKFEDYTKKMQVFDLPFLFNDIAALDFFQQGDLGKEIVSSIEEFGLLSLGHWHNGMKQIATTRPLTGPADMASLKCRTQPSDVLEAQFKALNVTPIDLPFDKVCEALQSNVVHCWENTWSNLEQKLCDVKQYLYETNHGVIDYLVVTNAAFWNGLPEDIRIPLKVILDEVTREVNSQANRFNRNAYNRLLNNEAVEVQNLNKSQRVQWRSAMQKVWEEFDIGSISPPSFTFDDKGGGTLFIPALAVPPFGVFEVNMRAEAFNSPMEFVLPEVNYANLSPPPLAKFFIGTGKIEIPLVKVIGIGNYYLEMNVIGDEPLRFSLSLDEENLIPYPE